MSDPFAVVGDSHVSALMSSVRRFDETLLTGGGWGAASVFFHPFFEIGPDGISCVQGVHYDLWKRVTRAPLEHFKKRVIVSMGLAPAPFYASRGWRTYGFGRKPVSSGLIDAAIGDMQSHVLKFYRYVIENELIAAAYMAPPPQRRHPVFQYLSLANVQELSDRYRRPVLELLRTHGVPLIELPLHDEDGYLLPEYQGSDFAHAGDGIGKLAFEAITSLRMKS